MRKSPKWYKGNRGLRMHRAGLEAYQAGELNSKNKVVTCKGCGKDTTNRSCLCEECDS